MAQTDVTLAYPWTVEQVDLAVKLLTWSQVRFSARIQPIKAEDFRGFLQHLQVKLSSYLFIYLSIYLSIV
jgi:hypothetical protein